MGYKEDLENSVIEISSEIKKRLDASVKQMQIQVFTRRFKFEGPSEKDNDYMVGSIMSIDAINKNFKTDYLTHELVKMKLTDNDGMVQDYMPHLPFHKGDENIFSGK